MLSELVSFFESASDDEDLRIKLRSIDSLDNILQVASQKGFTFSESDLITHFAQTLTRSSDDLAAFLKFLLENGELQERLRLINTPEGIVAVAYQFGYHFTAADLINHFTETLLQADDAQTVILFDSFGWDFAFLPGVIKHVHAPIPTNL